MDPLTLIAQALVAGAAASAQSTAGSAVRDGYDALKALILRRFAGQSAAETVLVEHEKAPETWDAPLKLKLSEVDADQDPEIMLAAQHLLSLTNPQQAAAGKYNVQISGSVRGLAQGDHQQVTMTFNEVPDRD
jgi:hypothetical protein